MKLSSVGAVPPATLAMRLTPRERDVLSAVCKGYTSKQIAIELGIRPRTVVAYIEHVRLKLGAVNRCHMVALSVTYGLCTNNKSIAPNE